MHGVYRIIQPMRSTRDRSEIELRQTRPYPGAIGKIGGGFFRIWRSCPFDPRIAYPSANRCGGSSGHRLTRPARREGPLRVRLRDPLPRRRGCSSGSVL
jgi:hypothetical protein